MYFKSLFGDSENLIRLGTLRLQEYMFEILNKTSFADGILHMFVLGETVGREIFRFAQHPPHTRFDTMGGFFDQYKELLGTLSPCAMVHLSSRTRYVCYPFKPKMCSKFVKYTTNLLSKFQT